jgi:hypothetical protein
MMRAQTSETRASVVAFAPKKGPPDSTMMTDDAGRTSPSSYSPAHWRNIGEVTTDASAIPTMCGDSNPCFRRERASWQVTQCVRRWSVRGKRRHHIVFAFLQTAQTSHTTQQPPAPLTARYAHPPAKISHQRLPLSHRRPSHTQPTISPHPTLRSDLTTVKQTLRPPRCREGGGRLTARVRDRGVRPTHPRSFGRPRPPHRAFHPGISPSSAYQALTVTKALLLSN